MGKKKILNFKLLLAVMLIGSFVLLLSFSGKYSEDAAVPDNNKIFVPDQFEVTIVADSIEGGLRHIAVNANGDIYGKIKESTKGRRVVALRDVNKDGKADNIEYFGDYDNEGPYGTAMRIYNGYLYCSSELVVYRYKLTAGQLSPSSPPEIILTDDHPHGMHEHIAKPVSFDDKGNMYVPFGAPSNACQERNRTPKSPGINPCPLLEDHAGVWVFDANKQGQTQKDGKRYATGLRSIVGMDWNAADKQLYVVQHGRDDLRLQFPDQFTPWQSAIYPSEEFLQVKEGSNSGWPYCYYDQVKGKNVLNPEYGGDGIKEGNCAVYEKPVVGFPGHWAPNDLFFYTGNQFPARYKNGAFISFHGSTNRAPYPQSGYFFGFVPFKNGKATGNWEVFADGFAGIDPIVNTSDAMYRPMGIAMGPDGSLYLAETEKGRIWRVTYKGDRAKFTSAQLSKMEARKKLSHIRTPDPAKDNLRNIDMSAGEKIYSTYCVACHQQNGKGDGNRFPPLDGSEWVTGDKSRLVKTVLKGLTGQVTVKEKKYNDVMPAYEFLSDSDLSALLTYVRKNFGNGAGPVTIEDVSKARR